MLSRDLLNMNTTKHCCICTKELALQDFYKNRNRKDGLESRCKECRKQWNREKGNSSRHSKAFIQRGGYGIYRIGNIQTEEFYIGRGLLRERSIGHFTSLKKGNHFNKYLQAVYNSDPSSVVFEVLEETAKENCEQRELDYLIEYYIRYKNKLLNQHITIRWDK
jgi:hypothetical protein